MGRATCVATFKISKKFRNIKLSRTPLSSLISLFNLYNSLKFVSREIKIKILRIAINSNNNDCFKFSLFCFISRLRENYVFWTMLYELVESEPFFSLYTTNIIVSPWNGSFCLIVVVLLFKKFKTVKEVLIPDTEHFCHVNYNLYIRCMRMRMRTFRCICRI